MSEYLVVAELEPHHENTVFAGQLPLHITILQWFRTRQPEVFLDTIEERLAASESFTATTGAESLFGQNHDIPVRRVQPSLGLTALHEIVLELANEADASLQNPAWSAGGYSPHITYVNDIRKPGPDEIVKIERLAILQRDRVTMTKKVVKRIALGEADETTA